ncbi:hypothetical protein ACQKP0_10445 [Heyndrickxia sp. NPDC080065]|uniref:hypothetical protein n=1 Tax=Heyndrickxia sp. NPDC080065 TaxID=3390568 RepID=UPI003CFF2155
MKLGKETLSLFKRDLFLGFSSVRFRWITSMSLFVIILIVSFYQLKGLGEIEGIDSSTLTYTDLLFNVFRGKEYPTPDDLNFKFPFLWLIIQLMGPFIIGGYVRDDLFDQSSFLFVRAKQRLSIWMSKLFFAIAVVISMYLIMAIITFLFSIFFLSVSPGWSEYGMKMIKPLIATDITPFVFSIHLFLLPFFITLLIVVVQAIFTVFMRPIYAFIIMLSMLVVSVFTTSRLVPGSYSMILRHHSLDSEYGFTWTMVIIYIIAILLIVVCSGYFLFKKMDIFPKERD